MNDKPNILFLVIPQKCRGQTWTKERIEEYHDNLNVKQLFQSVLKFIQNSFVLDNTDRQATTALNHFPASLHNKIWLSLESFLPQKKNWKKCLELNASSPCNDLDKLVCR